MIATPRGRGPGVDIRAPEDGVLVDRRRLTARQREVLETAHERGYFARPREANATAVAAALGVAPSAFREHLVVAGPKLPVDI